MREYSAVTAKGAIMLERIAEGRTDLVFDYLADGHPPSSKTSDGGSLIGYPLIRALCE